MDKKQRDLNVRVQPELLERFSACCKKNYKTVSEVVRDLMSDYIKKESEVDNVVKQWKATRMLDGIQEELVDFTAIALENQRRINEAHAGDGLRGKFNRLSIPLVRRSFPTLKSHGKYKVTSRLETKESYRFNTGIVFESYFANLDDEAKYAASLADRLRNKIDELVELCDKGFCTGTVSPGYEFCFLGLDLMETLDASGFKQHFICIRYYENDNCREG